MAVETEFKVVQGRIVLFKMSEQQYYVSLITQVNENGSVQLTLFHPNGSISGRSNVERGDELGKWSPPGVSMVRSDKESS